MADYVLEELWKMKLLDGYEVTLLLESISLSICNIHAQLW